MGTFYSDNAEEIRLYETGHYPSDKRELRAKTIAGLRVIQNSRQLDQRTMRADVFKFLLSDTALSYWKKQGWLAPTGRTKTVHLTAEGLVVCSGSLHDDVATNTSEEIIESWERKMTLENQQGQGEPKPFKLPLSWA